MIRFAVALLLAIAGIYLFYSAFFDLFFSLINPYIAGAFVTEASKIVFGIVLIISAIFLGR